jgi:uncharacterized protein YqgC (DUF456 family)
MQFTGLDTLQSVILVVMALGVVAGLLPLIPGPLVTWLAALAYDLLTGLTPIKGGLLAAMTIFMLAGSTSDIWLGSVGAKRGGASGCSAWLAALAGVVGLIAFNLIGAILLPIATVLVFELIRGRDVGGALRAGGGYFVGWALSVFVELVAALAIMALWLWQVNGWRAVIG